MRRPLIPHLPPDGEDLDSHLDTNNDAHVVLSSFATTTTPSTSGCIPTASIVPSLTSTDHPLGTLTKVSRQAKSHSNEEAIEETEEEAAVSSIIGQISCDDNFLDMRIPQLDGVNDGRKHAQHSAGSSSSYQSHHRSGSTPAPPVIPPVLHPGIQAAAMSGGFGLPGAGYPYLNHEAVHHSHHRSDAHPVAPPSPQLSSFPPPPPAHSSSRSGPSREISDFVPSLTLSRSMHRCAAEHFSM